MGVCLCIWYGMGVFKIETLIGFWALGMVDRNSDFQINLIEKRKSKVGGPIRLFNVNVIPHTFISDSIRKTQNISEILEIVLQSN